MKEIKIDEIVLFQFRKIDKHKIYAHAKNCDLKINIFNRGLFLLGIYLPKKNVTNTDLILDLKDAESFILFIRKLKNNGVVTHISVYKKERYLLLDS